MFSNKKPKDKCELSDSKNMSPSSQQEVPVSKGEIVFDSQEPDKEKNELYNFIRHQERQLFQASILSSLAEMAGGIAHEINNPLAVIKANSNLSLINLKSQENIDIEALIKSQQKIVASAERICNVIKSMRILASDSCDDAIAEASVQKIVHNAVDILRSRLSSYGIQFIFDGVGQDELMKCRSAQITLALFNLINNAFDAVKDHAGLKKIVVEVTCDNDFVTFRVLDSGPGVSSEHEDKILQPFFTTKEVGKGTGLGLSVVRGIADEHNGELEYVKGTGMTCFKLKLPRYRE